MEYGAQLYTVRDYTKTPEDIKSTLTKIKNMGFNVIQISAFGPCDIDDLAGWVHELGLDVCCTHNAWSRFADKTEFDKMIDDHKKLGCSHVGLGSCPSDVFEHSYEGYSKFIDKVNDVCKRLAAEGMTFGYHNHDFEFEKFGGVRVIDRIIEECPDIKFILDTFWVQAGGCNPIKYIEKLNGRIEVCHFKDYRISNKKRTYAEIGRGNFDWDEMISACKKANIPYTVIEQDADFDDPFESLAISLEYLQGKI